jgi:hypothetical protein
MCRDDLRAVAGPGVRLGPFTIAAAERQRESTQTGGSLDPQ